MEGAIKTITTDNNNKIGEPAVYEKLFKFIFFW